MQTNLDEFTNSGLQSYIKKLTKKDGDRLKLFIAEKFHLSFSSIDNKFRYGTFSAAELIAMNTIFAIWKK